jgi:hypothetical protein
MDSRIHHLRQPMWTQKPQRLLLRNQLSAQMVYRLYVEQEVVLPLFRLEGDTMNILRGKQST